MSSDPAGHVFTDEKGQIWWQSAKPGFAPELLADSDSLCGAGPFETDPEDPFRDDCSVHDNCYRRRAFFEERGWNRESIDQYFLQLMLHTAQGSDELICRAYRFYGTVRLLGWIWYYKHPGYKEQKHVGEGLPVPGFSNAPSGDPVPTEPSIDPSGP